VTARLRSPANLGTAAILGVCCLIGLLAGIEPKLALVGAVGLSFALLIFVNFTAGVSAFAFVSFLEVLDLGSSASVGKLAGGMVIAGWVAAISTRDKESTFFEDHPTVALLLGLFLAWITLGMTWAESPSEVGTALTRYIPNVMLIPIVYTAVRDRRGALMVIAGLVLGALAAVVYGLAHPAPDEARLNGTALDPNELASILVAGVALSGAFVVNVKDKPGLRLAAIGCIVLCILGIFFTVSRGGLVALSVSLIAGMIIGGRWRPVAFAATLLIASGSFFYFAVLAPPAARERIASTSEGETQLKEGRTTIWAVAERVVESKPLIGIGANNFQTSARHYLLTQPGALGRTDLIIATPKVVHNTYLGMAAELGLIGLSMFIVIVLFCVRSALRAARYFAALGDRGCEALSRGLAVGLLGTLVADIFISEEYSKPLWLLLGLCPAMLGIAVRQLKAARERGSEIVV
jgi:putative inorganic carbon (hco3(-)) transporter